MLEILALRAGSVVAVRELMTGLWGEDPPRSAAKTIQTYVSALRRLYGPDMIDTEAGGYRLCLDANGVDALRFDRLTRDGQRAVGRNELKVAVEHFHDALALWRGEPIHELTDEPPGMAEAARLLEMRRSAEEQLLASRLQLGEHSALIGDLEQAVATEPFRETRWAQLMLALYRSGRQADALRAYQRLRSILADELGLEPSSETRALEAAILVQDPDLGLTTTKPDVGGGAGRRLPSGNVTFLFTDIEGSTSLIRKLRERYPPLLQEHRRIVRSAISDHGGVEVSTEGDSFLIAFDDAAGALVACLEAQRSLTAYPWPEDGRFRVRMGLHTGIATPTPAGDYVAVAVHQAARIVSAAHGGQVLVSTQTAAVLGDDLPAGMSLVDRGLFMLAGFETPERIYQLQHPDLDASLPALRARQAVLGSPHDTGGGERITAAPAPFLRRLMSDFVGRGNELNVLADSWSLCERRGRGVALLTGEAGIGKTQLALRAAQQIESGGGIALYGSCDEQGLVVYQALTEAFRRLDEPGGDVVSGKGLVALVEPFLEDGGRRTLLPDEDDASRYRLFDAVARWLVHALNGRPAVLIVDDLQWADPATVLLLRHLVRCDQPLRLLVLVTFRSIDMLSEGPLLPALVEWQKSDTCRRIDLGGLTLADIDNILEQARTAGDRFTVPSARDLLDLTEGNPFFIQQVLQTATDTAVPRGVRDLVLLQTTRLDPSTRAILRVAAAMDGTFDIQLVRAVTDLPEHEFEAGLETAVSSQMLVGAPDAFDRYRFAHELARRAIYDRLNPLAAAGIHHRLAVALEQQAGDDPADDLLASMTAHFLVGSAVADTEKAIHYGQLASDAAMVQFGYETAARILNQTLVVHEHGGGAPELTAELRIRLGRALTSAGDVVGGKREFALAANIAERVGRSDLVAAAAIGYGGPLSIAWEPDQEHLDLLERALALPLDVETRARLQGRLAQSYYYRADQRSDQLSAEAVELARRSDDAFVLSECLIHRFWATYGPFRADSCLPLAIEVVELGDRLDDPEVRLRGNHCLIHACLELGNLPKAREAATLLHQDAARLRQPQYLRLSEINQAMNLILEGRFADGERVAEQARHHSLPRSEGEAFIVYAAQLCFSWWLQGRLGELLDMQEKAYAADPERTVWQASLCWIHAETDEAPSAQRYLDQLLDRPIEQIPADLHWWPTMVGAVLAVSQLRYEAAAMRLRNVLLPLSEHLACIGQAAVLGSTHHYLGLLAGALGDLDDAASHLEVAIDRHAALGSLPLEAISQIALVDVLRKRADNGDAKAAAGLLESAERIASRLSMRRVVTQCAHVRNAIRQGGAP